MNLQSEAHTAALFYSDMTHEEACDWMARNVRATVAGDLDHLRASYNLGHYNQGPSSPAARRQVNPPVLSCFYEVPEPHSLTLSALVTLAWRVNRFVEINFVSNVPSREVLYPAAAPEGCWPSPLRAVAAVSPFLKLKSAPRLKTHELKAESRVAPFGQPVIDTHFVTELAPIEPENDSREGDARPFRVALTVVTDITNGGTKGPRLMQVRTSMEVDYLIHTQAPRKERNGLEELARTQSIHHAWPLYGDILKTAAARAAMPLSIIRLVQNHLAQYLQNR